MVSEKTGIRSFYFEDLLKLENNMIYTTFPKHIYRHFGYNTCNLI